MAHRFGHGQTPSGNPFRRGKGGQAGGRLEPAPIGVICPRCGGECERDEVDNGLGMEAAGPWGCPQCHWIQPAIEIR